MKIIGVQVLETLEKLDFYSGSTENDILKGVRKIVGKRKVIIEKLPDEYKILIGCKPKIIYVLTPSGTGVHFVK